MKKMISRAKKRTGLSDLLKEYAPQQLEEIKKPAMENPIYQQLFHYYQEMLQEDWSDVQKYVQHLEGAKTIEQQAREIAAQIPLILNPAEINAVLQTTRAYEDLFTYCSVTGIFITRLIQNSFDANYNHFMLDTSTLPKLENVGEKLRGTPKRKVSLEVIGKVGGYFGFSAYDCSFFSHGSAGLSYGYGAQGCRYEIEGGCVSPAVDASYSEFVFHGKIKEMRDSHCYKIENSIFRTSDEENIPELLNAVPVNRGNKIYFINADGIEKLERDL